VANEIKDLCASNPTFQAVCFLYQPATIARHKSKPIHLHFQPPLYPRGVLVIYAEQLG
jgi:hypothetical protein